jgi:hypothetical protein
MAGFAVDTVLRRAGGERPSRTRSFFVAALAAIAAGVVVYRLLRSAEERK